MSRMANAIPPPDDWADVTPDDMAELEVEAAEAAKDLRRGQCIPVEKVFADRGMPYPSARTQ